MSYINLRDIIELDTIDGYSGGEQMWPVPGEPYKCTLAAVEPIVKALPVEETLHLPPTQFLAGWRRKFYYFICNQ